MTKLELYQKAYSTYLQKVQVICCQIQAEGHSESTSLAWEVADTILLKWNSKCFTKKEPKEVLFCVKEYLALAYNRRFIVSFDGQYLNIWRKVGTGLFSYPIQVYKTEFATPIANKYLLSLANLEAGKFYDFEGDTAWELWIETMWLQAKDVNSNLKESVNRLLGDLK